MVKISFRILSLKSKSTAKKVRRQVLFQKNPLKTIGRIFAHQLISVVIALSLQAIQEPDTQPPHLAPPLYEGPPQTQEYNWA